MSTQKPPIGKNGGFNGNNCCFDGKIVVLMGKIMVSMDKKKDGSNIYVSMGNRGKSTMKMMVYMLDRF